MELGATRKMLERAPGGHADWRPHEKSMTLATLATHLAELPGFPSQMLEHDELDVPAPGSEPREIADADERLAVFDEASARLRDLVEQLTWDRAQLGVYLRMLGIPIPGTYGPSADESWNGGDPE